MSSGSHWQQQQQEQQQGQSTQHHYPHDYQHAPTYQQQQQTQPHFMKQSHSFQSEEQQPHFYPAHHSQIYSHLNQEAGYASTSSPSASPLSARPGVSIHAQNYNAAPFNIADSTMDQSQTSFSADDTILAGMGIHLGHAAQQEASSSSSSFPSASFEQASQFNQEQSGYAWPQSQSSQSVYSQTSFDLYGASGSSNSSQSLHQQHPDSGQRYLPNHHPQQEQSSPSTQYSRRPARLGLSTQQRGHHPSPSWTGIEAATPNASTSGFEQDQQQHISHSPSWQQTSTLQQQQQQQQQQQPQQGYHYSAHPQSYRSESFNSAAPMQDLAMVGTSQENSTGQVQQYNTAQLPMFDTPIEEIRPISRSSAISFASSSNNSSIPYTAHRSNSQSEFLSDPSEGSYFGQVSQGSSSSINAVWMDPSPSESDSSSQMQQQSNRGASVASHRKISTPQRIQHMRDPSAAMSSRNVLSSPGGKGHLHGSPATSIGDYDYTDHRLSAALASNARISASSSDFSSSISNRGNTTPTILEEEQIDSKQHVLGQQSVISPSPSQQLYMHSSPLSHGFGEQPGSTVMKRHRPFLLQPSVFQQYSPYNTAEEPRQDVPDCTPFIDELISAYITTPSRLGLGEKSVLIMTSKVAQKSYGQEKRFLCPPPMVVLVGSSWWSSQASGGQDGSPTVLTPPRLTIAMSEQNDVQEASLEWASVSGKLIDVRSSSAEMAISGRSIGKQLYISDADDKKRHCEALVHITVPGTSSSDRRSLGTFASKPIKVISKPSKKRQSNRTSDLSVNHGSTISLFHRLRSQTVSTRYLCVSGAPTWFKGSDGLPFLNTNENTHIPNQGEPSSCFVAKMSSWDTFIIYLVDPHIQGSSSTSSKAPFQPNYPPPPINVLPRLPNGQGQPICYNQAVVLQCLNTAVVSPVMIIRRVDRQTTVVGGGQSTYITSPTGRMDPTVESLGDPVSQLHKIAFEILEDANAPVPLAENRDISTIPGQSGHFLGCVNEDVGLRKPLGPRQWIAPSSSAPSTPTTPATPLHLSLSTSALNKIGNTMDAMDASSSMMSEAVRAANLAAAQTQYAMIQQRSRSGSSANISPTASIAGPSSSRSQYSSAGHSPGPGVASSPAISSDGDGSQSKRPRRVSSSVVVQKDRNSTAAKNRRRGQSMSIVGMQNQFQTQQPTPLTPHQHHQLQQAAMQSTFPVTAISSTSSNESRLHRNNSLALSLTTSEASSAWGVPSGAMWTVDVHDSDIWTIVGTDIAQHTFYIPPKIVGGVKPTIDAADQGIAHLINVPAPATPITPIPVVQQCTGPNSTSSSSSSSKNTKARASYVTLTGENLTNDLFVYFGDWRCTRVTSENDTTLYCEPPPSYEEFGLPRGKVPLILVRRDGVIFPTSHIYQC